ncbi:MAG: hypothetical protein FJW30_09460 [Acidobacteria bacterium]|nr:hypothetical protein [Acidobacteriota bacterium]
MSRSLTLILAAMSIAGQDFAFVRVAATNTPRPDGNGTFNINIFMSPAMEGTWVAFTTQAPNASLWSFDLATSRFVKLADTNTPAPGGTGNFSEFGPLTWRPLISGNTVVFLATDQKTTRPNTGLFSVPITGGAITRIANYNTPNPSGGTFGDLDGASTQPWGVMTASGNRIVFASINSAGAQGIYAANLDGTGLVRIVDRNVEFPLPPPALRGVNLWNSPSLWNNSLVFYGQTLTDPSTGYNGIYTLPPTGGGGVPSELFNSLRALPGNSNSSFHTRLRTPPIAIEDQTIAFVADDPRQAADRRFRGLFTMQVGGGALRNIADINSTLPGIGTLVPASFESFCLNSGKILFRVVGGPKEGFPAGENALMLWRNGTISKVIAVGDMLDGRVVRRVFNISNRAMSGDRFAFLVDFAAFPGPSLAIYIAVPVSATSVAAVQNAASYTPNVASPGGVVTVYGNEIGPATLRTFAFDQNLRIPTVLDNARILVNGEAAPVLYTSANQASAIVPYSFVNVPEATITAQFGDRVSRPFSVPLRTADPGLFSLDRTGRGPGAILNEDGSVNGPGSAASRGSIVVLFGAGFGQTNPASTAGEITPAANPPRLTAPVSVTVGGQAAQVLYAGPAPGAVTGLYQFNVRLPDGVSDGELPVRVVMGATATQDGLTVSVR